MKEASDEVGIYTSDKLIPKNIGVATEIASISVSIVKLLVLPVCTSSCSPMSYDVGTCESKTRRNYLSSCAVA